MNYYIQGDPSRAQEIKAAFEKLGYDISWPGGCANPDVINIGVERNGAKYVVAETSEYIKDIIKTHPDYQELELPVEPKFKVHDWVVDGDTVAIIYDLQKNGYVGHDINRKDFVCKYSDEGRLHLWTIADAKDGDVLMTTKIRNCPFIYRKTSYNNQLAYYYAGIDGNGNFSEGCLKRTLSHFGLVSDVVPATKEQRDLLFAKMKEAGYQWDADKKELKNIQPHYDISNFKAGMPVLVRWYDTGRWRYSLYSFYEEDTINPFDTVKGSFTQCIPFNEETKHLLGTTDMCDERFINW